MRGLIPLFIAICVVGAAIESLVKHFWFLLWIFGFGLLSFVCWGVYLDRKARIQTEKKELEHKGFLALLIASMLGAVAPLFFWTDLFIFVDWFWVNSTCALIAIVFLAKSVRDRRNKRNALKIQMFEVERLRPERAHKQRLARRQRDLDYASRVAADKLKSARFALVELLHSNLLRSTREETVRSDLEELWRNHRRLRLEGDYGLIEDEEWHRHLKRYVTKKLQISDEKEVAGWVKYISDTVSTFQPPKKSTEASELKNLSPTDFESVCAEALEENGWKTQLTKASGDQGVDVIASKPGKRVAIQCKLYSNTVGNKAVQEALAGKSFINADFACVVTNALFTRSAKELASTTGVLLLHFEQLGELDTLTKAGR